MEHAEHVRLITTLLDHIEQGTTHDAGGVMYNPVSAYTCPEVAARERQVLFDDHPQIVGMSADLPAPGSFLTHRHLGVPLLLTRTGDGECRAFVNSCRHRGAMVETAQSGTKRRFVCPFHNWAYDADGALVGLPKPDHFGTMDRSELGLVALPAVERYGLLWVHQRPEGQIDPDALLGNELAADLAGWQFTDATLLGDDCYEAHANWKLALDTYGEAYHVRALHSETLSDLFIPDVSHCEAFGRNYRFAVCHNNFADVRDVPVEQWDLSQFGLAVYWLFPNVMLIVSSVIVFLVRAYPHPTDPARHTSQVSFYGRHTAMQDGADVDFLTMAAREFGQVVRDEDYAIAANIQSALVRGAVEHFVFGRNEASLQHLHNMCRSALGDEPLKLAAT